ncbi:MAG: hypothetical protein ABIY63_03135 [Fibrobacteria bacterium]
MLSIMVSVNSRSLRSLRSASRRWTSIDAVAESGIALLEPS